MPKRRKVATFQKLRATSNYTSIANHSLDGRSQSSPSMRPHKYTMKEENWSITKPHPNTRFAFVTITSLVMKEILLTKGFPLGGVFLHTNVTNHTYQMEGITYESTCCAQRLALTIVVMGINTCYAEDLVSTTLHTLMEKATLFP